MSKGRTLSNRIEAIEYIHADDGQPYRHDFTRTGSTIRLQKDGSVVIRNKDRKLWDMFDVDGKQQPYLINPSGSKHMATKRRSTRRRSTAATKRGRRKARVTSARKTPMANPKKRRRRRNVYAGAVNPPKRRRRRNSYSSNPPRRRRRRTNPPFSTRGLISMTTNGLIDGALVVGGKTIARLVSAQFPYPDGSMMDSFVEVAAAIALGMVSPRFLGADRARFLVAGAFASPLETLAAQAKIPQVSNLLGKVGRVGMDTSVIYPAADLVPGGGMSRVGAYSAPSSRTLGAYAPQPNQSVGVYQS